MHNKKVITIFLMTLLVLVLIGCKKKDEDNNITQPSVTTAPTKQPTQEVTQAPTHDGEMKSYLSGEWVPNDIGTKRPIAFAFNNFKTVRNQWGIGQADIVYECLVEGGITRLLGIGENYTGDRIGSTRSARHYFASIADEYDAIYIHFGGTSYAKDKVNELGLDEIDGITGKGGTIFYRDESIKAPHNAFSSEKLIKEGLEKYGYETKYASDYKPHFSFYDKDTVLSDGTAADGRVGIHFSTYNDPYFQYNAGQKVYERFQFGEKHVDSLTNKQLAFKNIIIQFVKEWNIDKKGYQTMDIVNASGSGYYITNGKKINITWKKKEAEHWMRYYDESGNELTINSGKTYIALFPNSRTNDVTLK